MVSKNLQYYKYKNETTEITEEKKHQQQQNTHNYIYNKIEVKKKKTQSLRMRDAKIIFTCENKTEISK